MADANAPNSSLLDQLAHAPAANADEELVAGAIRMLVSQEGAAGASASGRDLSKAIAALPQEALDGLVDSIVAAAPPPPQPKASNKKAAAEQQFSAMLHPNGIKAPKPTRRAKPPNVESMTSTFPPEPAPKAKKSTLAGSSSSASIGSSKSHAALDPLGSSKDLLGSVATDHAAPGAAAAKAEMARAEAQAPSSSAKPKPLARQKTENWRQEAQTANEEREHKKSVAGNAEALEAEAARSRRRRSTQATAKAEAAEQEAARTLEIARAAAADAEAAALAAAAAREEADGEGGDEPTGAPTDAAHLPGGRNSPLSPTTRTLKQRFSSSTRMLLAASESKREMGSDERMKETVQVASMRSKLSEEATARLRQAVLGMVDDGSMDWQVEWDAVLERHHELNARREEALVKARSNVMSHATVEGKGGHGGGGGSGGSPQPWSSPGGGGSGSDAHREAIRSAQVDLSALGKGDGHGEAEDGAAIDKGFVSNVRSMVDELVQQAHVAKRALRERRRAERDPHAALAKEMGAQASAQYAGSTVEERRASRPSSAASMPGLLRESRSRGGARSSTGWGAPTWLKTQQEQQSPDWLPRYAMPRYAPDAPELVVDQPRAIVASSAHVFGTVPSAPQLKAKPQSAGLGRPASAGILGAGKAGRSKPQLQLQPKRGGKPAQPTRGANGGGGAASSSGGGGGDSTFMTQMSGSTPGLDELEKKMMEVRTIAFKRSNELPQVS